ncbi:MAG: hypothetical protein JJU11_09215 [Candidatus Sumerlaeia bacterium]|nr:hypothetical protein [Candidatus Sumerlaeia bacterium]
MKAFFIVRYSLLCLLGFASMFLLFGETLGYHLNSSIIRLVFHLFWAALLLEVAIHALPRLLLLPRRVLPTLSGFFILAMFAGLLFSELWTLHQRDYIRSRSYRIGWPGYSDSEILADFTATNRFYPNEGFLEEVRRFVPEDEAVLYVGSMRGDPINYALYPRRVYMMPDAQRATMDLLALQWRPVGDPMFPEGFAPNLFDGELPRGELAEEILSVVRDKNIKWFLTWDVLDPEAGRLWRITE